jgi:hypothetical protein
MQRPQKRRAGRCDHIRFEGFKFDGGGAHPLRAKRGRNPTRVDLQVATVDPATPAQSDLERRYISLTRRIGRDAARPEDDMRDAAGLLRVCRKRPSRPRFRGRQGIPAASCPLHRLGSRYRIGSKRAL